MNSVTKYEPLRPTVSTDMTAFEQAFFSGRNENTVLAYRRGLAHFAEAVGLDTPAAAMRYALSLSAPEAHSVVDQWSDRMVDEGLAPSTINQRLSALSAVYRAAERAGLVSYRLTLPKRSSAREADVKELDPARVKEAIAQASANHN